MLDGPDADSSGVQDIAVHRRRFTGGRFLMLGNAFVLDTATFQSGKLKYGEVHPNQFAAPLGMSPDAHSFVRFGYKDDNSEVLLDCDFAASEVHVLPLTRARTRYNSWEELDGDWLRYHFEWRPGANGHLRLAERDALRPLPYRGQRPRYDPGPTRVSPGAREAGDVRPLSGVSEKGVSGIDAARR
jgi:hypothetical protein